MDIFTVPIHITGTLGANVAFQWMAPFDCQLIHVSAGGSNTNNGILDVGNSGDADAYLDAVDIGDATQAEWDRTDFVGEQYPHITDGTIITVALDYDGSGGTATANFTCVLTFSVG